MKHLKIEVENDEFLVIKDCKYGWKDGSCCCNCNNQLKIMCHPRNEKHGVGSINCLDMLVM